MVGFNELRSRLATTTCKCLGSSGQCTEASIVLCTLAAINAINHTPCE